MANLITHRQSIVAIGGHDGTIFVADNSLFLVGLTVVIGGRGLEPRGLKVISVSDTNAVQLARADGKSVSLTSYSPDREAYVDVLIPANGPTVVIRRVIYAGELHLINPENNEEAVITMAAGALSVVDANGNSLGSLGDGTSGGTSSGTTTDITLPCESNVQPYDAVYLSGPNVVSRAQSNSIATATLLVGFVVSKPTPTSATIRPSGILNGWNGLQAGRVYFLGLAPGAIDFNVPVTATQVVVRVGFAVNSTTLLIQPDPESIVLE